MKMNRKQLAVLILGTVMSVSAFAGKDKDQGANYGGQPGQGPSLASSSIWVVDSVNNTNMQDAKSPQLLHEMVIDKSTGTLYVDPYNNDPMDFTKATNQLDFVTQTEMDAAIAAGQLGDVTNVIQNASTVQNNGNLVIEGDVTGAIHNSCGASVANGSTVTCTTNINGSIDASNLTDDQLAKIRGERGYVGETGKDGLNGTNGTNGTNGKDGLNGRDGTTTVVNEYDKDQVDVDFATDVDVADANKRITDTQVTIHEEGLIRAQSDANIINGVNANQAASQQADGHLQAQIDQWVDTDTDTHRTDESVIDATEDVRNAGDAKALVDANAYTDGRITGEAAQRNEADLLLAGRIATNKEHIDANSTESRNADVEIVKNQAKVDAAQDATIEADQARQDEALAGEVAARIDGDVATLADAKAYADANDADTHRSDASVIEATQAKRDEIVKNQTEVDVAQNVALAREVADRQAGDVALEKKKLDKREFSEYAQTQSIIDNGQSARITQAEADIYNNTEVNRRQQKQIDYINRAINGLDRRVTAVEGMIAGQQAANSIILPSNFNGNIAVGVGVGHYAGHNGLAIGVVHDTGDFAVKATVSGTDADEWSELAYGASVNWTF